MILRAARYCLAGRMRPVDRRLESPALNNVGPLPGPKKLP